MNLIYQLLSWN